MLRSTLLILVNSLGCNGLAHGSRTSSLQVPLTATMIVCWSCAVHIGVVEGPLCALLTSALLVINPDCLLAGRNLTRSYYLPTLQVCQGQLNFIFFLTFT